MGSLVLGLGIFGGVGLLQSHGLISISKPVASFLGKLGATPHHVSLWVTAVGGISAGGALCGLSIYNICKKNPKSRDSSTDQSTQDVIEDLEVVGIPLASNTTHNAASPFSQQSSNSSSQEDISQRNTPGLNNRTLTNNHENTPTLGTQSDASMNGGYPNFQRYDSNIYPWLNKQEYTVFQDSNAFCILRRAMGGQLEIATGLDLNSVRIFHNMAHAGNWISTPYRTLL